MQEGIGRDLDRDPLRAASDRDALHAPHRRFGLALDGAECTEVVLAEQHLRGRMHARRIERPAFPGGAAGGQRRARIAIEDDDSGNCGPPR